MPTNVALGLVFHWIGGLAAASFYVPYKQVKRWAWEIVWVTGGVFSWIIAPWLFAALRTHGVITILSSSPTRALILCASFGALWGIGGLTYGLTMRYLGLSLGMAVVIGLTTAIGTLAPPLWSGTFHEKLIATAGGNTVLAGILITLVGFVVLARAGHMKDSAVQSEAARAAVSEFNFSKGILVALFSGVMSSFFAFGIAAGEPIRQIALATGTGRLWQGLPVLCVVLSGGAITNLIWCAFLIVKNRTAGQWLGRITPSEGPIASRGLWQNYALSCLGGTTWYVQLVFYTMGESQMGRYGFSSWTLHLASYIIFGTVWGFALNEWKGAPRQVVRVVWSGVGILVLSTILIGVGNYLSSKEPTAKLEIRARVARTFFQGKCWGHSYSLASYLQGR